MNVLPCLYSRCKGLLIDESARVPRWPRKKKVEQLLPQGRAGHHNVIRRGGGFVRRVIDACGLLHPVESTLIPAALPFSA